MTSNTDTVIQPDSYDFLLSEGDGGKPLIGLKVNTLDGAIIVPMTGDDAKAVGAVLVAHADYLAQRPVRRWATGIDTLT